MLHIDGTDPHGNQAGDARCPPFVVFDAEAQENVAGPFTTYFAAQDARECLANKGA